MLENENNLYKLQFLFLFKIMRLFERGRFSSMRK